jgi:replicative DNA helicase
MSQKNNLIDLFQRKVSFTENLDDQQFIEQLQRFVAQHEHILNPVKPVSDLRETMLNSLTQLDSEKVSFAIPTGWKAYDASFGGVIPGEMMVIGGRPAMGKTQLLVQLALNISVYTPVLYCSFDISEEQLATRFMANLADVSSEDLLLHRLTPTEKERVKHAVIDFQKSALFISDENPKSITQLLRKWEEMIQNSGVKVIFVDYLQLISNPSFQRNRNQELSYVVLRLKQFAQEHKVALVISSQLSRAVESRGGDRRPLLADLRESGVIEQDADKVAFIYRPEYYGITEDEFGPTEHLVHLVMAKNRNGKIDTIYLKRTPNFNRVVSLDEMSQSFRVNSRWNELEDDDDDIDPF